MKKEYHHGNLRAALIEAAAKLAAEHGTASLSLREAAREAGVSHAAPYHHFGNKAGLLAAVAEEGFRRFDHYQERALKSAGADPKERLKALGKSYVKFALNNPHFFRVMFREDVSAAGKAPEFQQLADRTFQRLVGTVKDCQGSKQKGMEPPAEAIAAWSLVHGLSFLLLDGPLKKMKDSRTSMNRLIEQTLESLGTA